MSANRLKLFATSSPEELESEVNEFLAKEGIEAKSVQFETNGLEKPYNAAVVYHAAGK